MRVLSATLLSLILLSPHTLTDERAPRGAERTYTLQDYFSENPNLARQVEHEVATLTESEFAGALLMPAWEDGISKDTVRSWICEYHVGGIMLLRAHTTSIDTAWLQSTARACGHRLPLLIAMDAEPTLIAWGARSLPHLGAIPTSSETKTQEEVQAVAERIHTALNTLGVTVNFAPVVDGAGNTTIISERSFGGTSEHISTLADAFIQNAMSHNIIPTIKHFPGHGSAVGDTHKTLESIPSTLRELPNFTPLLAHTPLLMVGHLAVAGGAYDTHGIPATLSSTIMRTLLRDELNYTGVTITDAMNMGAVRASAHPARTALLAGADIILMPVSLAAAHSELLTADASAQREAAMRVTRLKLVLAQTQL